MHGTRRFVRHLPGHMTAPAVFRWESGPLLLKRACSTAGSAYMPSSQIGSVLLGCYSRSTQRQSKKALDSRPGSPKKRSRSSSRCCDCESRRPALQAQTGLLSPLCAGAGRGGGRGRGAGSRRCSFRALAAISSGVPVATMRPPPSPPSGPRSMIQSAVLMTSRLCSMTSTVLPGLDQRVQHFQQLAHILEMQAGGRLVEDVERAAGGAPRQFLGQLDPLRLAARQRRRRLADMDVAEPDLLQGHQLVADRRHRAEELGALVDRHVEHVGDRSCPGTALRASRGCSACPCTRRIGHRRRAGSASRS